MVPPLEQAEIGRAREALAVVLVVCPAVLWNLTQASNRDIAKRGLEFLYRESKSKRYLQAVHRIRLRCQTE